MYDFYFSDYFAYYICKDKGEENRREPGASLNPISDNQDYQISVHESDFYSINFSAYYICKDKESKNKIFQKKFSFSELFSILIMRDKRRGTYEMR